jgi:hypothetical protein
MPTYRFSSVALLIAAVACAAPAVAQPGWGGGWGRSGWGSSMRGDWGGSRVNARSADSGDSREGRVDAAHFVADDAGDALGHGPITVTTAPERAVDTRGADPLAGDAQESRPLEPGAQGPNIQGPNIQGPVARDSDAQRLDTHATDTRDRAVYEAAVIDQLVKAGYDTTKPDPAGGQIAELKIVRDVLVPQEAKRKPVSGEMTIGASNYGTYTGMAIGVDLSKPRKALISTRLEARVRDRATGKPLWEGRAEIATREGDSKWTDQAIATRLAQALFERFPDRAGGKVASR